MFQKSNTVGRQIFSLISNPWALACFGSLAVMEMISASSSLWLVKIMQRITGDQEFIAFLALYLGSLLLPSIPWCLAFVFRTSWRQEAQREFIKAFVSSNRSNIVEWGNKGVREQKMSLLTSEGPQTLNNFIDYAFEVSSYALSVFCNIVALSIIVEPLFIFAFLFSLLSVILIMKMRRRAQRQLTKKALTARIDLTQSLLGAWDNVLIGNDYNFHLWQERTQARMNRCLQKNVDLERFDQIMAILVSLITMIPALIVVVYFVMTNQGDKTRLASFFVTTPILFIILSYTYQMLGHAFRWGIHKSKLTCVYQAIQPTPRGDGGMANRVKWPKVEWTRNESSPQSDHNGTHLSLPAKQLFSHHDLIQFTASPGRITLRGENGSGKSTILRLVKQSLSERAFLLPTHSHLNFTSETNKYSTGETLKKRLVEIIEKVNVDVILLDEWDANLDRENRQILSDLIDQISEVKCVIEVRHR